MSNIPIESSETENYNNDITPRSSLQDQHSRSVEDDHNIEHQKQSKLHSRDDIEEQQSNSNSNVEEDQREETEGSIAEEIEEEEINDDDNDGLVYSE